MLIIHGAMFLCICILWFVREVFLDFCVSLILLVASVLGFTQFADDMLRCKLRMLSF